MNENAQPSAYILRETNRQDLGPKRLKDDFMRYWIYLNLDASKPQWFFTNFSNLQFYLAVSFYFFVEK